MEVCGCNGICKGAIVRAIKEQGLFSLDEVRKHTKASSSCGSCTGLVEQILASTVGGAYQPAESKTKPVCGCTDHSHEDVRRIIREHKLLTIPQVTEFMEWRTPNGCASCRRHSTITSFRPGRAKRRTIRSRATSTNARTPTSRRRHLLRGAAHVGRQHQRRRTAAHCRRGGQVPDTDGKLTGGQRVDLLGVKKQDLPAVWRDLGMPSGHAYAKRCAR